MDGGTGRRVPADVLALDDWYLTTPEAGAPMIVQPELSRYEDPRHFFVDGDEVVFRAYAGGGTTRNSTYPRCELRGRAGGTMDSWSTTAGTHELALTARVTQAPPVKPQVVLAQIHDAEGDVIEVMYDGKKRGGAIVLRYAGAQRVTLAQPYTLGEVCDLRVVAGGGEIVVVVGGRGRETVAYRGGGCYFKAGCYTQSNPSKGDRPDACGEVRIAGLVTRHA